LERDAVLLRWLAGHFLPDRFSVGERSEALRRIALRWPAEPSPLLRLAAVAHGLEEGLDERLAGAPEQLAAWAARDPWSVEPDEVETPACAPTKLTPSLGSVVPRQDGGPTSMSASRRSSYADQPTGPTSAPGRHLTIAAGTARSGDRRAP